MQEFTLKEFVIPMMKAIDKFNYLLKSHHRKVAIISYHIGREMQLSDEELFTLVMAASLHDIGALTVIEREELIKDDIDNPTPHCIMGAEIIESNERFENIATIVRHHHIQYQDLTNIKAIDIPMASHIIQFADRVDLLIPPSLFIVNHGDAISKKLKPKVGTVFEPSVYAAFLKVSESDDFWADVEHLTFELLFEKLAPSQSHIFSIDDIISLCSSIAKMIDFRSEYTLAHSYSVAHLAERISSYFDFSQEQQKMMLIAGYVHDIGKLGIDPRIIEKKEALTPYEINLMKMHVYYSERILSELNDVPWFKDIIRWCERHHERIDGSGYPYSLHGESLDDGCKILAFADAICEFMEKRAQGNELSIDSVFRIVKRDVAPVLSGEMFNKIEPHKEEIEQLIIDCQKQATQEYQEIGDKIVQAAK